MAWFYLGLSVLGAGWAWIWLCAPTDADDDANPWASFIDLARVLACGFLAVTLCAWIGLESGFFSGYFLAVSLTLLVLTGVGLGSIQHRAVLIRAGRRVLPACLVFLLVLAGLIMMGPRGEWLAGGWDPGVYMNQGMYAAQHGGWNPEPLPAHADLAREGFNPFVRIIAGRSELFPGIPINLDTGALQLTFYPITPAWIAFCYALGGVPLANQAFLFMALFFGVILLGALLSRGASPAFAVTALVLTLLQPLVIYHARTPNSELMELLFVAVLLLLWPSLDRKSNGPLIAIPLFLGLLNRPTFFIWTALLFPVLLLNGRLRGFRVAFIALPLAAALLYYQARGSMSLDRLTHVYPYVRHVAIISAGLALLVAGGLYRWGHRLYAPKLSLILLMGLPILVAAGTVWLHPTGYSEMRENVTRMIPYLGWPLIVMGGTGLVLRAAHAVRHRELNRLDQWLLWCLCVGIVPWIYKHVADLYPWATKRYLSSISLILGIGTAITLHAVVLALRPRVGRWAALPLIIGILIPLGWNATRIRDAWLHIEYPHLNQTLSKIAEAVDPHDDVLVADHFVWGTPLCMIHQRTVLNGERLWQAESEVRTAAALQFLAQQANKGRRVLLLTSTERGAGVFPAPFQDAVLVKEFPPYSYQTIAHHRRGSRFAIRARTAHFRLYELHFPVDDDPGSPEEASTLKAASINFFVNGCCGALYSLSLSAHSTHCPLHMTPTRSLMYSTTLRSWAMKI